MCKCLFCRTNFFRSRKGENINFFKDVSRSIASRDLFCFITNLVNTRVNHSSQIHARNGDTLVNTVFHIHCVAFRSAVFSVLFLPGLDNKWSRYTDIYFLPYSKIKVTGFFRGCKILDGSSKFSQSQLSPLQDFVPIRLRPCLNMLVLLFSTIASFVAPIGCIPTNARFIIL